MLLTSALAAASMMALAQTQPTGCEETFRKGGNPVTGLRFVAERSVADLSPASAIGQLRGIVIAKVYIVMAAEPEAGTILIEQPAIGKARGFPIEISVSEAEGQGTVRMEARLRAAMAVKEPPSPRGNLQHHQHRTRRGCGRDHLRLYVPAERAGYQTRQGILASGPHRAGLGDRIGDLLEQRSGGLKRYTRNEKELPKLCSRTGSSRLPVRNRIHTARNEGTAVSAMTKGSKEKPASE
jgi:hypothetical protein